MIPKPRLGIKPNFAYPLVRGLIGLWLMNENNGNKVFDLSGNNRIFSFLNSPIWSSGKFGNAILFDDGSSQGLDYNSAILTSAPITMACWFNIDDSSITSTLINIADTAGDDNALGIQAVSTSKIRLFIRSTIQTWVFSESTQNYNVDKWHFACGVFASSAHRLIYLDGIAGTPETTSCAPVDLDVTSIGYLNRATPTGYTSGKISHVMIWNRALSAGEIFQLYRDPFSMFEVDL